MRMSCNGCRVLRKGCSEDCTLRPSLQWIQSPDSQANATHFLAKFYGRAGLLNLINAGPTHQRPDVFKSLLYEACGRIINPVYGSAGLISSGDWTRCQEAVEAVLSGVPLSGINHPSSGDGEGASHRGCDIRHARARGRKQGKRRVDHASSDVWQEPEERFTITGWAGNREDYRPDYAEDMSHDSWSVETVEPTMVNWAEQPETRSRRIGLDLTLGRDPAMQNYLSSVIDISDSEQ